MAKVKLTTFCTPITTVLKAGGHLYYAWRAESNAMRTYRKWTIAQKTAKVVALVEPLVSGDILLQQ